MKFRPVLLSILLVCVSSIAFGRSIYVTKTGNNANNGQSLATSWLTIGHACSTVVAGDTVNIGPGTWRESHPSYHAGQLNGVLVPTNSGASGRPIVYRSIPDSTRAIISGNSHSTNGFDSYNRNYLRIERLEFTDCSIGVRLFSTDSCYVQYCSIHDNLLSANDNQAGVLLYDSNQFSQWNDGNVVRACTISQNYMTTNNTNAGGIFTYYQRGALIENNVVYGGLDYYTFGIRLKHGTNACVIRGNTVYGCTYPGIKVHTYGDNDSIYNNIVYNCAAGISVEYVNQQFGQTKDPYIWNNTIYNCTAGIDVGTSSAGDRYAIVNNNIWNNIVVGSSNDLLVTSQNHTFGILDYNCYYTSGNSNIIYWKGTNHNLTWHQSNNGLDLNSVNVNPVFLSTTPGNASFLHLDTLNSPVSVLTRGRGGSYHTYMGAYDPDVAPPVDLTPPTITNITKTPSSTSCIIRWNTNELATDTVNYGLTNNYGSNRTVAGLRTSHADTLTGLQASTLYHYRVRSEDANHNKAVSGDSTFTTASAAVDQVIFDSSTVSSATLTDDLSGGTVPYDSLVLHWSTNRANVVSLSARDTRVTGVNDPYTFSKTSLPSGTKYYFRVLGYDIGATSDTTAIDSLTILIPDTTPPTISGVSATNVSSTSAIIIWSTNEAATSEINYGFTSSYGQSSNLDQTLVLSHSLGLSSLQRDTLYHYRVRSRDAAGNEAVGSDNTFRTLNIDDISLNVPDSVSGTYPGYSQTPVNDGVVNPRGGISTTWASDESSISPHWVTVYFSTPKVVQRARLAWSWNSGNSSWMCSRQFIIQYWEASSSSYINAAVVNNTAADSLTVTDFAPVVSTRIRYWQPANMGPSNYPSILWLTEFTLYGREANGDVTPPAPIQDLNAIPSDGDGRILLSWTAPSDNGGVSDVSYYDIRYSPDVIDDSNWDNASVVPNTPAPVGHGERQEFVVSDLPSGEIYYMAIKSYDEAANASSLSNVPFSYASGIVAPQPFSTLPDSSANLVVVTCEAVESYYALYYEFELDTSIDFVAPRTEVALLSDSLASSTFDQIVPDLGYFWRCRAIASTNADTSAWSRVINFNLYTGVGSILSADDCISPAQGDVVETNRPVFTVRRTEEVNAVYFQVDDNMLFSSPQSSGEIAASDNFVSWRLSEPLGNPGLYFWRASADNLYWTEPLSFSAVLDIHAYPNPFRTQDGGSGMTFCNLPGDAKLTIATVSGGIVRTIDNVGTTSEWVWDTKNDDGDNVASGVYLYRVSYGGGSSSGKLMVIR